MSVVFDAAATLPGDVTVRVRPVLAGPVAPDGSGLPGPGPAATPGFSGAVGETAMVAGADGSLEILLGMGEAADLDGEACRRAGAAHPRAERPP